MKLPRSWCRPLPSSNCTQSSTMFQTPTHHNSISDAFLSWLYPVGGRLLHIGPHYSWSSCPLPWLVNQRPSRITPVGRERSQQTYFGSPSSTDAESLVVAIPLVITTPSGVVLLQVVDLSNLHRCDFLFEYLSIFYTSLYVIPAL